MGGMDEFEPRDPPNMNTDPSLIIVTPTTHREGETQRPVWMHSGSFVVFRKLEQNVKGFEALTDQWDQYKCESKAQMGAKLIGRWQSGKRLIAVSVLRLLVYEFHHLLMTLMIGAPIVKFHTEDTKDPNKDKWINDFVYDNQICPVSAHIRKTNIRERLDDPNEGDTRAKRTRMIRNGIPYGPDYKEHETDETKRGLLFACYQGAIEDAFEHMQSSWSNDIMFRSGTPDDPRGHDPIIGQTSDRKLKTVITDKEGKKRNVEFEQLVTLKGGGYFFAPSIKALREDLSNALN